MAEPKPLIHTRRRYVSLAEFDKGMRDCLQVHEIFAAKPVMMRSFQAAKSAAQSKARLGPDFVERGKEFRYLLGYVRQYFEMYAMFNRIDTNNDRRIQAATFHCQQIAGCRSNPCDGHWYASEIHG